MFSFASPLNCVAKVPICIMLGNYDNLDIVCFEGMSRKKFKDTISKHKASVKPPVGGVSAMNGVSFFMTGCFCRSVFTACRPVSTAPFFLSSVSSVVPVMLAQQHYKTMCMCVGEAVCAGGKKTHLIMCVVWLWKHCNIRSSAVCRSQNKSQRERAREFLNASFNCCLGGFTLEGSEWSSRHNDTRQRPVPVSTQGVCDMHLMAFVRAWGWAVHCDPAPWQRGNPQQ